MSSRSHWVGYSEPFSNNAYVFPYMFLYQMLKMH